MPCPQRSGTGAPARRLPARGVCHLIPSAPHPAVRAGTMHTKCVLPERPKTIHASALPVSKTIQRSEVAGLIEGRARTMAVAEQTTSRPRRPPNSSPPLPRVLLLHGNSLSRSTWVCRGFSFRPRGFWICASPGM